MSDYISREAAIKAIQRVSDWDANNLRYQHEIERVPAADVRPVVRGVGKLMTRGMLDAGCVIAKTRCTTLCGQGVEKRVITNADRIRAKSDEELASLICNIKITGCPDGFHYTSWCDDMSCADCWLEWLKQEADT